VVGYGAVEGGDQVGRFRLFVVMNPDLLRAGPADLLFEALLHDLTGLGAESAWTRELAYDLPLYGFFRRRGLTETQRFRTPQGIEIVVMEMLLPLLTTTTSASNPA
jgi:hypothetical protein